MDDERAKCAERFPPYTDLVDARWYPSLLDWRSGVNGEEFRFTGTMVVEERWRGEGVRGIRPPAVREEKSPAWDLRGVDTVAAVAILKRCGHTDSSVDISNECTSQCLEGDG